MSKTYLPTDCLLGEITQPNESLLSVTSSHPPEKCAAYFCDRQGASTPEYGNAD